MIDRQEFAPAQTATTQPDIRTAYQMAVDGDLEPMAALKEIFDDYEEAALYAKGVNERLAALKNQIGHLVALSGQNVVTLNGHELRNTAPSKYKNASTKRLEPVLKQLNEEGLIGSIALERIRDTYTDVERAGSLVIQSLESINRRYGR